MAAETPALELSTAAEWLRQNPSVAERARAHLAVPGKAMPDAVLEDPTRLVDLLKETLVEAIRGDAPVGVIENLLPALRVVSFGAKGFDRNGYAAAQLSALQGLRGREEIDEALRKGLSSAPDETTRAAIERFLSAANAVPASDEHFGEPIIVGPDDVGDGVPDEEFAPGGTGPGLGQPRPTGVPGTEGGEPGSGGTGASVETSDVGAVVGSQIGGYLGGPEGAELGAQIGSEEAGAFNPLDGSNGAQFGAAVGARIATQLCGESCAQAGSFIGGFIGGALASHGGGVTFSTLDQITDAVTCALCGPACIPCTLAAESMGAWVAPPVR